MACEHCDGTGWFPRFTPNARTSIPCPFCQMIAAGPASGNPTLPALPVTPDGWPEIALQHTLAAVAAEVRTAKAKWPPFNSAHEAFAVLDEERCELREYVHTKQKNRDLDAMRREAIQVAAMAVRFALEVCTEEVGRK